MKQYKDIIIIGFALFSMFFGAGNLIFPPTLGLQSGPGWITSLMGFILADVGLAILGLVAFAKLGSVDALLQKPGKKFGIFLGASVMLCLGPLLAIPRTSATTFEMGIQPIFSGFNPILFSVIFFALTLWLSIKPSKVIDIVGQFLTPALLISLAVLIVKGIMTPVGDVASTSEITNLFARGITDGYQTMDGLAGVAFAAMVMTSIAAKGYNGANDKVSMTLKAGLVAGVALMLVYGGLAYLGVTSGSLFVKDMAQPAYVVAITSHILGSGGKVVLGAIVALACLTTAIGLVSAASDYFSKLSNGKLKYEHLVIAICIFSAVVSNFGVGAIIKFSAPILTIIYPPTVALVAIGIFDNIIKKKAIYVGAVYSTLLVSLLTVISGFGVAMPFLDKLPLASFGFNWIVPCIIGAVIGALVGKKEA